MSPIRTAFRKVEAPRTHPCWSKTPLHCWVIALTGTGPKDVWGAGESGQVMHFDGAAWSVLETGTSASLEAAAASGPGNVWFAGQAGTVLHFDGQSLRPAVSGTTNDLHGSFAFSPFEAWLVGDGNTILRSRP